MRLTRGAIPLYFQIAQILGSQIHAREYKPGDRLPTEDELMRELEVSRTTVRQALQQLIHEALIYRRAGKGTFVAEEPAPAPHDWFIESIDGLIKAGQATRIKYCGAKKVKATETLAKTFQVSQGADLTQIRKLEFAGDQPFIHITIFVPSDIAKDIPLERVGEKPVFALIEEHCGLRIEEAHQWISASLLGGDIARELGANPGDPALLVERHFVAPNGRVIQVSIDRYRTDQVRHYLRLRRKDVAKSLHRLWEEGAGRH